MAAKLKRIRAMYERTGGTLGACGIRQIASVLHPEIFVTCHAVTVTIYDINHMNRLFCHHILKVTCHLDQTHFKVFFFRYFLHQIWQNYVQLFMHQNKLIKMTNKQRNMLEKAL